MRFFSIIDTLKSYNLDKGQDDLVAAMTVTIMLVPQALAYAMLAGLPPEIGLYSSILPLVAYALFGKSNSLSVGPVAILALMTATAISEVSKIYDYSAIEIAVTLSLISGGILIIMGMLKLGFIVNFISRSVIEGFITASAILIAFSQLKHIFAIKVEGHNLYSISNSIINHIEKFHLPTFILGLSVFLILMISKPLSSYIVKKFNLSDTWNKFLPRISPAIMVIITIVLMKFTSLGHQNINIVGYIPNGIPDFSFNMSFDSALLSSLFLPALLLSIIGYIGSISVATRFAAKRRESVEPNSELVGLGAANLSSGFSGGMPVSGGFSRSVVNYNAGSKTPISGIMSALFIAIIVSGMMGLLEYLPKATLAAAIIASVIGLIDLKKLKQVYIFSKTDFFLMLITILTTLFFGVEIGISTGIIISIAIHLYKTSKPHMAIIGQVPGTEHFRNVLRHEVKTTPYVIGIRIDESLYFANASYLEQQILNTVRNNYLLKHCILMFSSVSDIDASALESLESLHAQLLDMGIELHLSEVKGPVMDKLAKSELAKKLEDKIHLSHFQAIKKLSEQLDNYESQSNVISTGINQYK